MNKIKYYIEDDMILKVEVLEEKLNTELEGSSGEYNYYKLKVLEIIQQSKIYMDSEIGEIFEAEESLGGCYYAGMWRLEDDLGGYGIY